MQLFDHFALLDRANTSTHCESAIMAPLHLLLSLRETYLSLLELEEVIDLKITANGTSILVWEYICANVLADTRSLW